MGNENWRVIINVSTGSYTTGQARLEKAFREEWTSLYRDVLPRGCPQHTDVPYAFKAFALKEAAETWDTLLWADACIVPGARPLADLWEKIERDGVWLARNGWSNYEWTADSAYPALFGEAIDENGCVVRCVPDAAAMGHWREVNRNIPHVVATAFGVSLKHPKGRAFLDEYSRLASKTKAFCGPWINAAFRELPPGLDVSNEVIRDGRFALCGPPDVRGHRHDQTSASVIAWRLGVELTSCPEWFAYRGGETDKTCLIADGAY